MNGFLVWYVLSIVSYNPDATPPINNGLYIEYDLDSCQKDAVRKLKLYPQGTAKWACHEMTTQIKGDNLLVNFPEN